MRKYDATAEKQQQGLLSMFYYWENERSNIIGNIFKDVITKINACVQQFKAMLLFGFDDAHKFSHDDAPLMFHV